MRFAREQAIPIELELEEPVLAGERLIHRLGVHHLGRPRVDAHARCARVLDRRAQLPGRRLSGLHFFDR